MDHYGEFFEWVRPTASTVAFVKFKGPMSSVALGGALAKEGISIKPTYCFTDDADEYSDYSRMGFGEKVMPARLDALAKYVDKYKLTWLTE